MFKNLREMYLYNDFALTLYSCDNIYTRIGMNGYRRIPPRIRIFFIY